MKTIEYITLNIASFGWIIVDVYNYLPTVVTMLVGLSIVFLNAARGLWWIKETFNKNKKDEKNT